MTRPLSTKQAADELGCSVRTVLSLIGARELDAWPQVTPGGYVHAWKVPPASIEAYIARQRRRVA